MSVVVFRLRSGVIEKDNIKVIKVKKQFKCLIF